MRARFENGPLVGKVIELLVEPPEELVMLAEEAWITEALAVVGIGNPDPERVEYVLASVEGETVVYVTKASLRSWR